MHRDNAEMLNNPKHVSVPERRRSRSRSRPLGVPKYSLERLSKSRSRSQSRSTLPTLDRTPKKGVDTSQNLDTGLNINQNLEGSERSMDCHDGNSSPSRNKSVRAKRHSRSRTRSKTPMNGQKKSPYDDHRTPRETFPITHCDNAETPETLNNPKHLSVPAKRHSRSRSKSRSRSRSTPKTQETIVDASRSVDTSLETSIDTSQNLEESEISTHRDDGNRSLPCNNSIRAKRVCRSRSRSLSLSTSLKPSPKIPSEFTDCGPDDSRTLSTSLTFDDREEEELSSGPDSQKNGYKGPGFCPRESDTPPSSRRKSVRNRTTVTPTNRDVVIEPTLDQGHARQTRQSRNKCSNSSILTPVPVHLQYQEGTPPVPSAADSGTNKMDIKSTFASNPKGLSLSQFDKLFKRNGMKLVTVPGNGFCFISCVLVTLAEQGINKSLDVLSVEIMIEITNHLAHYKQYGNKTDMTMFLAKCADYFQKGIYDSDAVDICIGAAANALGINVHVLQKSNDKKRVHMSSFLCLHSSSTDIYLHYYPGKLKGKSLDAHFNCYVNKDYYKKNSKSIASRIVRTDEGGIDSSNVAPNADQR